MSAPLEGVFVLDFTKFLPGPYCTWMLAELGAEVVRVEHPRELAKQAQAFGLSDAALAERRARDSFARGKQSLLLDPGDPANASTLQALVRRADVLVEDYRPGVMEGMGLGYAALAEVNPRLVYTSLTLCGQDGPYRDKPGHDPIALAISGALSRVGEDPHAPSFPGLPVADLLTGSNGVIGILAALRAREASGQGQHVDVAMSDAALPLVAPLVARNPDLTKLPPRGRRRVDSGLWRCADGRFVCTTDMEPRYWARFCEAVGRPDFVPLQHDAARRDEVIGTLADMFATRPAADWVALLEAAGTQVMPVLELAEALDDPHNRARGMVVEVATPGGGAVAQVGAPIRFSASPARTMKAAGAPGAEGAAILASLGIAGEG